MVCEHTSVTGLYSRGASTTIHLSITKTGNPIDGNGTPSKPHGGSSSSFVPVHEVGGWVAIKHVSDSTPLHPG